MNNTEGLDKLFKLYTEERSAFVLKSWKLKVCENILKVVKTDVI